MAESLLPDRIKAARRAARLTQQQAGDVVGLTKQAVSGWERGATKPSYEQVKEIFTGHGINADWVMTGDGQMRPPVGLTDAPSVSKPSESDDDEIVIRVHRSVRAGAAGSAGGYPLAHATESDTEGWRIARQRIYDLIGVWLEPTDEAVKIEGLSMKRPGGGLDDGQLVIFRPVSYFVNGQRYVFQLESEDSGDFQLFCKRIQVLVGRVVRLISDNRSPGFTDQDLIPQAEPEVYADDIHGRRVRIHIAGRVLWPREDDDEREIRIVTRAFERLASTGLLPA